MLNSGNDIKRRLVPRWRSLAVTLRNQELGTSSPPPANAEFSAHVLLHDKLRDWQSSPSVQTAGEALEAAVASGEDGAALAPAKFLLASPHVVPMLRQLAEFALDRHRGLQGGDGIWLPGGNKARWRAITRLSPRNPLAWTELSLFEAIEGRAKRAEKAMNAALALAPDNRHVLRSAARLFLHLGDPERAHDVLARSPRSAVDPWLAAAEIAVASVAERHSSTMRRAGLMLGDARFSDWDVTELSGAMGTEELIVGRRKRARDLFRRSVLNPTGNSLAQAEWVSQKMAEDFIRLPDAATVPEPDEAIALHYYRSDDYRKVVEACERWAKTEPYSIRPFEMASSVLAEEGIYEEVLQYARRGLAIRPEAAWLLNNSAFALANLERFDEAEAILAKVDRLGGLPKIAAVANRGLIAFKKGNIVNGAELYISASAQFRNEGHKALSALAIAYFAKISAELRLPFAGELLEKSKVNSKLINVEAVKKLNRLAERHLLEAKRQAVADDIALKGTASEYVDMSNVPSLV